MTFPDQPVRGTWPVVCGTCHSHVAATDTPPDDPQALLTAFADTACPLGGVGCPNTTAAQQARDAQRPDRLKALITAIQNRAPRTVRIALPALVVGTPVDVPVAWPSEMPDATYSVTATPVHGPGLLGVLRWAIKPGSLSSTGCTITVSATAAVVAGQAGLHLIAVQ